MKCIQRTGRSNSLFTRGKLYPIIDIRYRNGRDEYGVLSDMGRPFYVAVNDFFTIIEQPTKENQTMAQIPNVPSHADNARAFNMPYTVNVDPATAVQYAQKALADAEAALAAKVERDALVARLTNESGLAKTTVHLLSDIESSLLGKQAACTLENYAKYRKQLQPLAESYGYKIVLVGDKSKATLVQI